MSGYKYRKTDFEHPSLWSVLEDRLKGIIGGVLLYNRYFQTCGLKGHEKVLDFGCGGGAGSRCLVRLLKNGGSMTCLDISSYWIERAKRRLRKYPDIACYSGDIRKLDLPHHSFDVISIVRVIHDIPRRKGRVP